MKMRFLALIVLMSAGYAVAKKGKPRLQRIEINNKYGAPVACEFQWRDRHGAHTKQLTNKTFPSGQETIKAPLLGYYLNRIVAVSSSIATASLLSAGAAFLPFLGSIHAHGNRYFVLTAGDIPKDAIKGKAYHKVKIDGYPNEQAYKNSLIPKPVTLAEANAIASAISAMNAVRSATSAVAPVANSAGSVTLAKANAVASATSAMNSIRSATSATNSTGLVTPATSAVRAAASEDSEDAEYLEDSEILT